jgi:hypothetical protein
MASSSHASTLRDRKQDMQVAQFHAALGAVDPLHGLPHSQTAMTLSGNKAARNLWRGVS